jgi:glycosidase
VEGETVERWPEHPLLYEINTWIWLRELSAAGGRPITLAEVPPDAWDGIAELGFDAVWLMGVWDRSPAGRRVALANPGLRADFARALPDWTEADVVGSAYCVRRYQVDEHLGGPAGLAASRRALADRGLRLILDFVPNHVARDHPWVAERPECFVRGSEEDLQRDPASFAAAGGRVFACGRDPYFPAWQDVLQLDAFAPAMRAATLETMRDIAAQCDGVRCDMAMLLLDDVFARTWGGRVGAPPGSPYWPELIGAVRREYPGFRFIAEAYWDLEWTLQQQGFDFCYDKRLYDRLEHRESEGVRRHLCAEWEYQRRLVRFIENHDEPRAAATFGPEQARAAAVTFATLPGARLFHEGQLEGRRVRLPVFLSRRPAEQRDEGLAGFYRALLAGLRQGVTRDGTWRLLDRYGWPDNRSFENVVAWSWEHGKGRLVVVVNLSPNPAQARVRLRWPDLGDARRSLTDRLSGDVFERSGHELLDPGLFIALPPWGCHLLTLG